MAATGLLISVVVKVFPFPKFHLYLAEAEAPDVVLVKETDSGEHPASLSAVKPGINCACNVPDPNIPVRRSHMLTWHNSLRRSINELRFGNGITEKRLSIIDGQLAIVNLRCQAQKPSHMV